ncbi:uncharacterized protein LOC134233593 [Saccostrea cucullata]|uniref:uncharacterized protein LOC134233593 n=1 Tax=Saccostrea cuccullata TaxID=36930 RepID=UPI002ED1FA1A
MVYTVNETFKCLKVEPDCCENIYLSNPYVLGVESVSVQNCYVNKDIMNFTAFFNRNNSYFKYNIFRCCGGLVNFKLAVSELLGNADTDAVTTQGISGNTESPFVVSIVFAVLFAVIIIIGAGFFLRSRLRRRRMTRQDSRYVTTANRNSHVYAVPIASTGYLYPETSPPPKNTLSNQNYVHEYTEIIE